MNDSRDKESGFTLIELLVVILILGVLTGIALPIFINQKRTANEVSLRSDMNAMAKAVQNYYNDQDASKLTKVIPVNPDNNGWAILVRHEDSKPRFIGDTANDRTYNLMPENFPVFNSSQGVAIGVKDSISGQRNPGDYCLVGNADNSKFEASASGTGQNMWKSSIFFDSKKGIIIDNYADLDPNGACAEYKAP